MAGKPVRLKQKNIGMDCRAKTWSLQDWGLAGCVS